MTDERQRLWAAGIPSCMIITLSVKQSGAVPSGGCCREQPWSHPHIWRGPGDFELRLSIRGGQRSRAVTQSINPQPLTAEDRDRHRASPREICGGQLGSRRGFSSNVSILPCQYQSSNNPYSCKFADFLRGVVEDYCLLECRAAP
jgi:hypothetical protein